MTAKRPPFAVLFDLDGVLLDSHMASVHSQKHMGKLYGFTLEEVQSCSKRGGSLRDFYLNLQKLRPFNADFETFADTMLEANFQYLEKETRGTDQALAEFLDDLRKHGIPFAVGTSALKRSAKRKLALAGLDDHFQIMVTSDDVDRHKPHPDVYLETAKRVGVPPEQCIVIEDAEAGIQSGKAAGMKVVGFGKYINDIATLKTADVTIDDFSELSYEKLLQLVKQ